MPQGSVLGSILFSLYTTPLSKVIQNHPGISFQFYADDTQLYVHLTHKNVASALDKLSHCLENVKRWLCTNKLKLNPDKTEFIVFGSKSQREKLNQSFPVNILGNLISPIDAVRNLIVWFDSDFSFSCHVMKVCKAIQFRSTFNPTFSSFENISIAIGSSAQLLVLTCVYRPPGSCFNGFLDQFLNLLEYLSLISPLFLICGDFNISSRNSRTV